MIGEPKESALRFARIGILGLLVLCLLCVAYFLWRHSDAEVHFSRDVRPILNQNCMPCHGGVRQKNGVSFLFREEALGTGKSGKRTIVPGSSDKSELIARVTSSDPDSRMPYHAPPLSQQQIDVLQRWIKQGAKWEDHWAFVAPKQQALPAVKRGDWPRQPLDRFVLARDGQAEDGKSFDHVQQRPAHQVDLLAQRQAGELRHAGDVGVHLREIGHAQGQADGKQNVDKAQKVVQEHLARIKGAEGQIIHLDDPSLKARFPDDTFFAVRYRQFPVARQLPEGL